jgi:2-C-methyl-D-erythritol 4-phosphate cytidylyltransferase
VTRAGDSVLPEPFTDVEVVIQAAGRGERLGRGPKAFLSLGGRSLLERAVSVMRTVGGGVLAAVPPEDVERAREICGPGVTIVAGGATRVETLIALLASAHAPWVVLHDVVHPFVTPELARRVIETARVRGAAVAAIRSTSTAYHVEAGRVVGRVPAGDLWLTTKPWAFRREAFVRGLAWPREPHAGIGGFLRRAGEEIAVVPAEPWNIKITTAGDWQLAEAIEGAGSLARGGIRP